MSALRLKISCRAFVNQGLQVLYWIFVFCFKQKGALVLLSKNSCKYKNLTELIYKLQIRNTIKFEVVPPESSFIKKIYRLSKSEIIYVDENSYLISNIKLSKKQKVIHCWHGGGLLKKIAYDNLRNVDINEQLRLDRIYRNISYILISDEKFQSIFAKAFHKDVSQILPYGLLRTDALFRINVHEARNRLEKKYPCIKKKKLILYAPTYRENSTCKRYSLFDLSKLKIENSILAVRCHPTIQHEYAEGVLNLNNEDLYELLPAVDVLVTDYSSILFDFAFFKKPILIYSEDLFEYEKEHGTYQNIREMFNNAVATNIPELIELINCRQFLGQDIWNKYMSNCDGNACDKLLDFSSTIINHDK